MNRIGERGTISPAPPDASGTLRGPASWAEALLAALLAATAAACGDTPTEPGEDDGAADRVVFSRQFPGASAPADSSAPLPLRPFADGDIVVFGGPDGRIHAFRPDDGEPLWSTPSLIPDPLLETGLRAVAAPWARPVAAGDVIVVPFPAPGGGLLALDRIDGAVAWTWAPPDVVVVPGGVAVVDGRVLAGTAAGELVALDGASGSVVWRRTVDGRPFGFASEDDRLLLGVHGLDDIGGVELVSGPLRALALGAADGREAWRFEREGSASTAASVPRAAGGVAAGTLVMPSGTGEVFGLDAADGSLSWRTFVQGGPARGLAVVGGRVLVQPDGGALALVDVDTGRATRPAVGEIASLFPVDAGSGLAFVNLRTELLALRPDGSVAWRHPAGDGLFSTAPVAHDGTVYIGTPAGFLALEASP